MLCRQTLLPVHARVCVFVCVCSHPVNSFGYHFTRLLYEPKATPRSNTVFQRLSAFTVMNVERGIVQG